MMLSKFIQSIPDLIHSEKIIYYGGSFNPWHEGHSSCLKLGSQIAPIVVIPDNNPQKAQLTHRTSPDDIQNIISEISPRAFLFKDYYYLKEKTPTYKWLKEVSEQFPNKKHALLVGHDSFINLNTWIDFHSILNSLDTIYVVSRMDDKKLNENKANFYKNINPNLNIEFLGNHPFEHLSSCQIRSE